MLVLEPRYFERVWPFVYSDWLDTRRGLCFEQAKPMRVHIHWFFIEI